VTIPNLAQHITAIQYHPVALPGSTSHTLFFVGGTPSPGSTSRAHGTTPGTTFPVEFPAAATTPELLGS